MQRLAREKICLQERLASLKGELSRLNIEVDLDHWKIEPDEMDSNSTSTATGKSHWVKCFLFLRCFSEHMFIEKIYAHLLECFLDI